jgi:hypothetical protein
MANCGKGSGMTVSHLLLRAIKGIVLGILDGFVFNILFLLAREENKRAACDEIKA